MNTNSILEHLDEYLDSNKHPKTVSLDNPYFDLADARLSVFRSEVAWVMFIEVVQCDHIAGEFGTDLFLYGNCVTAQGMLGEYSYVPFWWPEDEPIEPETGEWQLDRADFSILHNGKLFHFTPRPDEYKEANITFETETQGPGSLSPTQLLRYLCHKLDHPFFASEDYLRHIIDLLRQDTSQILSHSLDLLLQTQAWRHPYGEERPSDLESFQVLARMIASGDASQWYEQDQSDFNTDWPFWDLINKQTYGEIRSRKERFGVGIVRKSIEPPNPS